LEYTFHHSTPDAVEVLWKHAPNKNPFLVMEYYHIHVIEQLASLCLIYTKI
jgi:hypothetical protein